MIVSTGASDGLGRELAKVYKQAGKIVVNISRRDCEFADHNLLHDLRKGDEILNAAEEIKRIDEPLEAVVNCVAVMSIEPLGTITEGEIMRVMSTNVKSAILLVSVCLSVLSRTAQTS